MTDPTIDLLRRLDPTAGDDPAKSVGAGTRTELLTRIMQADAVPTDAVPTGGVPAGGVPADAVPTDAGAPAGPRRRRFLVRRVVPGLVAAGIVAGVAITVAELPGGSRQEALGPALSFSDEGKFLRVKIVDPEADSARYNAELKKHHLNITLELWAASPSMVGVEIGGSFRPASKAIKATGDPEGCQTAGTYPCVPTFLIPKDYQGSATMMIGRAAAPGEEIRAQGMIDGRGEPLQGVKYRGMTAGKVAAILADRGYAVSEYRYSIKDVAEQSGTANANPRMWRQKIVIVSESASSDWPVRYAYILNGTAVLDVLPKR